MDLLASIRKSGSRGGVNFSWDDVSTSQHRENYLGHSLMAPVGRWQKNRDLSWYAKAGDKNTTEGETEEERRVRERKEEIKRIKEAEEDALARMLGFPVADRSSGAGTGANAVGVGELNRVIKETEDGDDEIAEVGRGKGFGDFVAKVQLGKENAGEQIEETVRGGLLRKGGEKEAKKNSRDQRSRSQSRERRHRRHRHRENNGERHRHRSRSADRHLHRRRRDEREERRDRSRSRSPDRRDRRYRSNSPDRRRHEREDREPRRDGGRRSRRSRSPDFGSRR